MARLLLMLAALLSLFPASAGAAYSSLVVFGDSLSDNGNAFALSGGIWPPSPPYARQFSNGQVAAQRLAADLGLGLAPSIQGGTDYAVGGATTGIGNYNFEVQSPFPLPATLASTGVLTQVGAFAAGHSAVDPGKSLFMVWGGPNDFFLALDRQSDIPAAIGSAVTNLVTAAGQLAGLGARHILVPGMPDLAATPFGLALAPADRAALGALSAGFNSALAQGLVALAASPDLHVVGFDTAALLQAVQARPGDFGFSNVTDPCFDPTRPDSLSNVAGGCQGYLFFDAVHLTAAGHAIIGDRFFDAVQVPEPPTVALFALAVLLLALPRGSFRRQDA